jgi:IMP dehydrogenase
LFQGRSFKTYRGMGSIGAMREGSRDRYAQDMTETESKLVPEGIEGACRTKERSRHGDATRRRPAIRHGIHGLPHDPRISGEDSLPPHHVAGLKESHVHDVIITKEAPNYRLE